MQPLSPADPARLHAEGETAWSQGTLSQSMAQNALHGAPLLAHAPNGDAWFCAQIRHA